MDKFEKIIDNYDCTQWECLPKFIKRRVEGLKKIQLEQIQIQQQFHKDLHELELKYEKLYKPLYERKSKIINGEYEPTDEECKLPESLCENKLNGDQENIDDEEKKQPLFSEEEEKTMQTIVKGIPGFWLGCLVSSYNFNDSIEPYDRPILKYLKDIKLIYGESNDFITYMLEFHFDDNPYFTNKVLTKTYYLKQNPDDKDPFNYDGFEVCKSEGCKINWNPGKNPTTKTVTVKQKNKTDGRTREKKKEVEQNSFFFFFKPPESDGNLEDIDEELGSLMAVDFELGEFIRQSIIPNAPLHYDGYMMDEDDEDSEDDSEEDDDDDDDGSDSDIDDSDNDEESTDSLNAPLTKKMA